MKKLLALVLVLGMASVASAGYIVKNSAGDLVTDEIMAGDAITMTTDADQQTGYTVLVEAMGDATLDSSGIVFPTAMSEMNFGYWGTNGASINTAATLRASGIPMSVGATIAAGSDLFRNLVINGSGAPDAGSIKITNLSTQDSRIIDVVPEPMTMSLLGLGGLALIRRRRA